MRHVQSSTGDANGDLLGQAGLHVKHVNSSMGTRSELLLREKDGSMVGGVFWSLSTSVTGRRVLPFLNFLVRSAGTLIACVP